MIKRFFQSPWLWTVVFGLIASSAFAESNWGIVTRAYAVLSGATFTGPVIVPAGSASAPGLAISDANDGLFESADGTIGITLGGTQQWEITGGTFGGLNAAGPDLRNTGATATVPTVLPRSSTTSGIGATSANDVVIVAASTQALTVTSTAVTANGTVTSSGNDLGWAIVDQTDNQACTTGCTSACVFGWDVGSPGVLLACSNAAADVCLCAGSS